MKNQVKTPLLLVFLCALLSGCVLDSREHVLKMTQSQLAARSMQSRAFDTKDKEQVLRAVVATMQDLGFIINRADATLGVVSGAKPHRSTQLSLTVTAHPRGQKQVLVRANAQYGLTAIEEPGPYQDFFQALEKSLFLTALAAD